MKTRYKIITIIAIIITGFLTVPFYTTNVYCDVFEPANGDCIRISGIGAINYTNLPYFVADSKNTDNPNECWYQDDDGNISPCRMGSDGFDMAVAMFVIVFWPYITLGIMIVIIFIVWRKRK